MTKNFPIGFFDSGVGGLSVYSRFRKLLPNENTIYFGDLKNLPYGNKTQEELIGFARNILNFFKEKRVKAVVIACNTSSALAYEYVKDDYDFKIYPIIQSCAKVISEMNLTKIGVFATEGTVKSEAYKKEISKHNKKIAIQEIACPNWVSIVEGVYTGDANSDIKKHIDEILSFSPDKIILGCTHYPYLLKDLSQFIDIKYFIDPAEIFVEYIKQDLSTNNLLNPNSADGIELFYTSAYPEAFVQNSRLFYNVKTSPIVIEP